MSEAVAKAESIESGGKISIEDEMKPEAVKNEGPLLPDNDLKQKHVRRNAAHTKLTNQLRKAVADHKMGAIRLKKLQVAAWRDEFIRIFEDVKDLHHKYMESLPDITDINVKHVKNGRFNLTPTTWKSSTSPLEEVYSVGANRSSQTNQPDRPAHPEANVGAGSQVGTVKVPDESQRNIERLRTEIGVSKVHLRTIQEQVIDQGARIPSRPQTLSARQDVSARYTLKSLEATVLHRRTLFDVDTSLREQPSRPLPIMHPACGPSIGDDTSSDTSSEHQPANGSSNHPHGGFCSRPRTPNFTIQPFDGNPKNHARFKA
ncbi:hypothetical protein OUZ56_033422 [Daphnia magna]|uniref:Uncharacterized protein n=1 Tax=Daphnia magna TaxID=35525 RepID=A0ABQ9ZXT4_9CRUS|nr:hypothetical protein OUZ56_033422 [Daphnia magna]